eukprot:65548-Alexandrium_andersonii.AAC.1
MARHAAPSQSEPVTTALGATAAREGPPPLALPQVRADARLQRPVPTDCRVLCPREARCEWQPVHAAALGKIC